MKESILAGLLSGLLFLFGSALVYNTDVTIKSEYINQSIESCQKSNSKLNSIVIERGDLKIMCENNMILTIKNFGR